MTVDEHVVTATIFPDGLALTAPIEAGTLTMDTSWAPTIQGQFTVPISIGDLSGYLPDQVVPVRIEASIVDVEDSDRTWNLHARHIRKDHLAGTYTIDVASDEALVQDYGIRTGNVAFDATRTLPGICQDVLTLVLGGSPAVTADAAGLLIKDHLRVWAEGVPAWDYLTEICASLGGRVLYTEATGTWHVGSNQTAPDTSSGAVVPSPEDALSYVEEWSRNGDAANSVTVEFTGGDATYTTVAVPSSSPAVSVQVEDRQFGRYWFPVASSTKPAGVVAHDTSVELSRATAPADRNTYALEVVRRRRELGYYLTYREVSNYRLIPRSVISGGLYVDRLTHDFGTHEMTVAGRPPYTGDPV